MTLTSDAVNGNDGATDGTDPVAADAAVSGRHRVMLDYLRTLPGFLLAVAAVLTAAGALVAALK